MKKIVFFLSFLICLTSAAQPPTGTYTKIPNGYNWLRGYFKSLHLPAGNGSPALQPGQWAGAGAVYLDSTANIIYYFRGGLWQTFGSSGSTDTTNKWVNFIGRIGDSIVYNKGGDWYSISAKESSSFDTTAIYEALSIKQDVSDTNTVDATRYWVSQQSFLTGIDTANITNFSTKVRSLFSAGLYLTYSNGFYEVDTAAMFPVLRAMSASSTFDANRISTRDFTVPIGNLGTTTMSSTLEALLFPSQVPTASLTGGGDYELHSSGTFGATLNWSAGRQPSTDPLASIVVATVTQSFSQPSAPGTVSGTQAVTVTWNTNVGYTNLVTTTDSKTASASTAFNFYPKRYWGYTTTSPPSSADILTAAGGGDELTTSKSKSTFSIVVTGTNKYVYYTYPSSYGGLSSIIISGLESIGAFTQSTVSVTNASGYVQNYFVYTSNNIFNNTTISFNSVN